MQSTIAQTASKMHSTIDTSTATLELPFKRPFDWMRMLTFIGRRASAGVESVEGGVYRRAIE